MNEDQKFSPVYRGCLGGGGGVRSVGCDCWPREAEINTVVMATAVTLN